eukprot:5604523-Prymnesium_polylepis.1
MSKLPTLPNPVALPSRWLSSLTKAREAEDATETREAEDATETREAEDATKARIAEGGPPARRSSLSSAWRMSLTGLRTGSVADAGWPALEGLGESAAPGAAPVKAATAAPLPQPLLEKLGRTAQEDGFVDDEVGLG